VVLQAVRCGHPGFHQGSHPKGSKRSARCASGASARKSLRRSELPVDCCTIESMYAIEPTLKPGPGVQGPAHIFQFRMASTNRIASRSVCHPRGRHFLLHCPGSLCRISYTLGLSTTVTSLPDIGVRAGRAGQVSAFQNPSAPRTNSRLGSEDQEFYSVSWRLFLLTIG
jgi:hypothetical protein